ncbi:hypothetical protein [Halorubrum halophilum]|uniref:DUF7504 family protein n=1 Tax=Halorubrum halophilum TaxID=413816 RepID=UPI001D032679|nr:hypothetical protein [Halorubrum halophilum]
MPVPAEFGGKFAVRVSSRGRPRVRDAVTEERVISLLFDTDIEEWRRGWSRTVGTSPGREAIISANDSTRGADATTQVVPDRRLAYTLLGSNADVEQIVEAIAGHLGDDCEFGLTVLIDDVAPLLVGAGREAVEALVDGLAETLDGCRGSVVVGCSLTESTAASVAALFDPRTDVDQIDHPVAVELAALRRDNPTTFGYVRRHWWEAQAAIEGCERNYPQAKQAHTTLTDPETTPRTLGMTLSGLVTLGVLETWGETVGPTRYDLTAYDPGRMWAVGATLAADRTDGEPTND